MKRLLSALCLTAVLLSGAVWPAYVQAGGDTNETVYETRQASVNTVTQEAVDAAANGDTGETAKGDTAGASAQGITGDAAGANAQGAAGKGTGETEEETTGKTADENTDGTSGTEEKTAKEQQGAISQVDLGITAESAVLMEASTGTILFEKNCDTQLRPASITKIMTLILIFDALEEGKIRLDDEVTTSAYAKSMGGSQVFLEEGEKQTVETLIKCIVVASGNDASVTMAEHLAGSEAEFVKMMNERAASLNMHNTHFEDCCGLTESATHLTSARDVAIMSRELITKYPQISQYSTIWMENITHVTQQGSKEFGLANTNKLLKMNNSFTVTGLKTGSTSLAKYCLSATAEKDGIHLIAVVMAAPDYKVRFAQAQTMLNYGYANCALYQDDDTRRDALSPVPVVNGVTEQVEVRYAGNFSYLSMNGADFSGVEREIQLEERLEAPVAQGEPVGRLVYRLNGNEIGSVEIVTNGEVPAAGYVDYLEKLFHMLILKPEQGMEKQQELTETGETGETGMSEKTVKQNPDRCRRRPDGICHTYGINEHCFGTDWRGMGLEKCEGFYYNKICRGISCRADRAEMCEPEITGGI